jgi:hypothetical protein
MLLVNFPSAALQIGFFDIVAMPMFHNFTRVFGAAKPLFLNVLRNYNYWAAPQKGAAPHIAADRSASERDVRLHRKTSP